MLNKRHWPLRQDRRGIIVSVSSSLSSLQRFLRNVGTASDMWAGKTSPLPVFSLLSSYPFYPSSLFFWWGVPQARECTPTHADQHTVCTEWFREGQHVCICVSSSERKKGVQKYRISPVPSLMSYAVFFNLAPFKFCLIKSNTSWVEGFLTVQEFRAE